MFTPKHYAYAQVRNYICAQIAYTKEKITTAQFDEILNADYIEERKAEIDAYKNMLNLLSNKKVRICK